MPYVLLIVATFALGLLVYVLAGCRPSDENPRPPAPTVFDASLTEKPATRAELAARLERLAASPSPTELAIGASCYAPRIMEPRFEYVCPTCGEKTIYCSRTDGQLGDADRANVYAEGAGVLPEDLGAYRRLIDGVSGIALSLDESQFCRECRPDVTKPKVVLVVKLLRWSSSFEVAEEWRL